MEKITVRNNFHGTEITVRPKYDKEFGEYYLTDHQVKKCRRTLCSPDCDCGGELGERGPQEFIRIDLHQFDDGDRWYIV